VEKNITEPAYFIFFIHEMKIVTSI